MAEKFTLDFTGIGAERSATTWLADCLREHPQIYLPKEKELYFFNEFDPHFLKVKNLKYERGVGWYENFFKNAKKGEIKGEFSPTYLYSKETAIRIKKHFPQVKLIVTLRNPVERSFSQYLHDKHIGVISDRLTFEEVLVKHPNYIEKGRYAKYLKYYFRLFPRKNIFIISYDDIKTNPKNVVKNLYKYLGVESDFVPSVVNKKVYVAVAAKYQFLNYLLLHAEYLLRHKRLQFLLRMLEFTGIRKLAFSVNNYINVKSLSVYPEITEESKVKLRKLYKKDVIELKKLTGINFRL